MLRFTGLPSLERTAQARVGREPGALVLRFVLHEGAVQRFRLPLYTLGDEADPEEAELRLLAQLAALGYPTERDEPAEPV